MVSIDNGGIAVAGNGHAAATAEGTAFPLAFPSNCAQPEIDASRKRKMAVLPLEVGTRVNCRWRDGKYHPVKVIERRKLSSDGANDYEYYVHYTECELSFSFLCLRLLGLGSGNCISFMKEQRITRLA